MFEHILASYQSSLRVPQTPPRGYSAGLGKEIPMNEVKSVTCTRRRPLLLLTGVLASFPLVLACLGLSSCSYEVGDAGSLESVGTVSAPLGTVHLNTAAAEISVSTWSPNDGSIVATYNAEDPGYISYTDTNRRVFSGASMLGYTKYDVLNNVIKSQGRARPPTGWAVLWGDPSIARQRASGLQNNLYIANLAIPNEKFPTAQGYIEGAVNPSGLDPKYCGAYIGGACIARATGDGLSFSVTAANCVRRTSTQCPFGTFYDGSDMDTSPEGRVYAAFNDVFRDKVDVYMAPGVWSSFSRLPDPPGFSSLHPRIKYGAGALYLMVQDGSSLKMTRYEGGSSFTGRWTDPVTVATGVTVSQVNLSDRSIRLGPQYDFDIGLREGTNEVQIRLAYTVLDANGKHRVRVSWCTTGSTISCAHPNTWRTDSFGGEQWGPAIAAGFRFVGGAQYWAISFYDRRNSPSGNQVEMFRALASRTSTGGYSFTQWRQETAQVPCPDLRGYWGDYDDMAQGVFGSVHRGFTDSSHGGCFRRQFHATPQYASLLLFSCGSTTC